MATPHSLTLIGSRLVTYEADETPGKNELYFMFDHKNQFLLMGDEALRVWKVFNESEESSSN